MSVTGPVGTRCLALQTGPALPNYQRKPIYVKDVVYYFFAPSHDYKKGNSSRNQQSRNTSSSYDGQMIKGSAKCGTQTVEGRIQNQTPDYYINDVVISMAYMIVLLLLHINNKLLNTQRLDLQRSQKLFELFYINYYRLNIMSPLSGVLRSLFNMDLIQGVSSINFLITDAFIFRESVYKLGINLSFNFQS
ncbi:hypothetical protein FGO68_gene11640 [Halteria grandinella]|uniref:Uncharacterized protein n=1 Tax=Halteria grandinella TaxID=5974 RepID=A0A8J8T9Q0_HALGN|nr:hypothetical protein FGO68_gene11640 [Halteria grandinella]